MDNETIVRLKIISDIRTPEQITDLVGIACHRSWHVGDTRPKTTVVERNHGWLINSGLPEIAALETHVKALLSFLSPHSAKIKKVSVEDAVEFSIVIYASSPPAPILEKEVIESIRHLGARLDIDLYY